MFSKQVIKRPNRPESAPSNNLVYKKLEWPRFFSGQLLTDADLNQLVTWNEDKSQLGRQIQGWGVVCGLDVRVDSENRGRVFVEPGYAVDACGNDIILGKSEALDLQGVCPDEQSSCYDFKSSQQEATAPKLHAVDVMIQYKVVLTHPQVAIGRHVCREVAECDHARQEAHYEIKPMLVAGDTDPITAWANKWCEGYCCCDALLGEYETLAANKLVAGTTVKSKLLEWLKSHPLQHFPFVEDRINDLKDGNVPSSDPGILSILFWLVQDCRNAYLNKCRSTCAATVGVPLARVWLQKEAGKACKIVTIDAYAPYKRPLTSEQWPAPPGRINLGRFIWQREEVAWAELSAMGFELKRVAFNLTNFQDLKKSLTCTCGSNGTDCTLFKTPTEQLTVQILNLTDFPEKSGRVIGFCDWRTSEEGATQVIGPDYNTQDDDLKVLKHIGSKRAAELNRKGIYTYVQVAAMADRDFADLPGSKFTEAQIKEIREDAKARIRN
jgi:hypothetical protein